jgi:hypothetical protein
MEQEWNRSMVAHRRLSAEIEAEIRRRSAASRPTHTAEFTAGTVAGATFSATAERRAEFTAGAKAGNVADRAARGDLDRASRVSRPGRKPTKRERARKMLLKATENGCAYTPALRRKVAENAECDGQTVDRAAKDLGL